MIFAKQKDLNFDKYVMKDDEISDFIDALVEDFTLEELHDTEAIVKHFNELTGLSRSQIMVLLFGAVQIALLRRDTVPDWKQILIQRTNPH